MMRATPGVFRRLEYVLTTLNTSGPRWLVQESSQGLVPCSWGVETVHNFSPSVDDTPTRCGGVEMSDPRYIVVEHTEPVSLPPMREGTVPRGFPPLTRLSE